MLYSKSAKGGEARDGFGAALQPDRLKRKGSEGGGEGRSTEGAKPFAGHLTAEGQVAEGR